MFAQYHQEKKIPFYSDIAIIYPSNFPIRQGQHTTKDYQNPKTQLTETS